MTVHIPPPDVLAQVEAAVPDNPAGWLRAWYVSLAEPRDGHLPHGSALVERNHAPLGADKRWCVVNWAQAADGIFFYDGDYDKTYDDAYVEFCKRAKW
jgi:hypothetical protein